MWVAVLAAACAACAGGGSTAASAEAPQFAYAGATQWTITGTAGGPFANTSADFTLVNAGVGVKWAGDRVVTSLKVINLANQNVQQHIFGDIIKRQVVGEARFLF